MVSNSICQVLQKSVISTFTFIVKKWNWNSNWIGRLYFTPGTKFCPSKYLIPTFVLSKKIFLFFLLLHIDEERIGRKGRRRRLFLKRRKILRQMNIHELICTWCQFYLGYCWKLKKGSLWRSIKTVPKAIFQSWTLS